jgi:hypothetical protein
VINELDDTIKALLKRDLPPALSKQIQISFATPDDQFPPQSVTLPAINLFLYDVRENLELRSNEIHLSRRSDGTAARTRAPVRVSFSYLITAWSSDSAPDPAKDEHRLLGEVMRVMVRYRILPEEILQGELKAQAPPLPVSSLQPGRLQSLGEFWQAMGGKPKAALNYEVTLSVETAAPEDVSLVTQKEIKMRLEKATSKA